MGLGKYSDEDLKEELEKRERERRIPPKKLEDYSDDEKIEAFDKLYKVALGEFVHIMENQCESKDIEHWCYEAIMELLGEGVWDITNDVL